MGWRGFSRVLFWEFRYLPHTPPPRHSLWTTVSACADLNAPRLFRKDGKESAGEQVAKMARKDAAVLV